MSALTRGLARKCSKSVLTADARVPNTLQPFHLVNSRGTKKATRSHHGATRTMIDVEHEKLVAIREVPSLIPPRPSGKKIHISACYRWISRGVRGVKLEAVRLGGTTFTSIEAIQRFADRLGSADKSTPARTVTREKQLSRLRARLSERLGVVRNDPQHAPAQTGHNKDHQVVDPHMEQKGVSP